MAAMVANMAEHDNVTKVVHLRAFAAFLHRFVTVGRHRQQLDFRLAMTCTCAGATSILGIAGSKTNVELNVRQFAI